ncbi:MAG TPA: hypothetical protein VHR66_22005 [Gemmataceae bacterium]|nr:hypothetical protein [Gemmataceae bacterium]
MELTIEQQQAIQGGQAVRIDVSGAECIIVRKDVYDRASQPDYEPWSAIEMDLLAAEAIDLLKDDGFDELDDA